MKRHAKYIIVLLGVALALLVVLPACVGTITHTPLRYPVVSYSHVLGQMGVIDYRDRETPLTDASGRRYGVSDFDSLFPLLNFRQLMADGRMPDSIGGQEATMRHIMARHVMTRHTSADPEEPSCGLQVLFEAMPVRVGIELPGDVFSYGEGLRFTDCETLGSEPEKSARFSEALRKAGCRFPLLRAWGNSNPRKRYDEGYMVLSADSALYHIKMVNGRPFAKAVPLPAGVRPRLFLPYEPGDRTFYGFLFGSRGELGVVEARDEVGYEVRLFALPPVDELHDDVRLYGNMLHWVVTCIDEGGLRAYAYERDSYALVDTLTLPPAERSVMQSVGASLFGLSVVHSSVGGGRFAPALKAGPCVAWVLHVVVAVLFFALRGRRRGFVGYVQTALVGLFGLCGLVAALIVPES